MSTVVLMVTFVAGLVTAVTGRASSRCVPFVINGAFCRDLPYNTTIFPNIIGTHDARSAEAEAKVYSPLTNTQCSDVLEGFICSVYFPECHQDTGVILPCRETCESVRRGCEVILNDFYFKWPPKLDCSVFPFRSDANCNFFQSPEEANLQNMPETTPVNTQTSPTVSTIIESKEALVTTITQAPPTSPPNSKSKKDVPATTTESTPVRLPEECRRLPYKDTFFPNVLGHWSFQEGVDNFNTFRSMLSSACSEKLSKYLCLLHFPAYDESRNKALPPCYEFCLKVRTECLFELPVPWPGSFSCESLPTKITPDSQCWAEDSSISTAPSAAEVFTIVQGLFQFVKNVVGFVTGLQG